MTELDLEPLEIVERPSDEAVQAAAPGFVLPASELRMMVSASRADVVVVRWDGKVACRGKKLPSAEMDAPSPMSIPYVKRGLIGRVGDDRATVHRPRFGFRLTARKLIVNASFAAWRIDPGRFLGKYQITCESTAKLVALHEGRSQFKVRDDLTPPELMLALTVMFSGAIETSWLRSYLTI